MNFLKGLIHAGKYSGLSAPIHSLKNFAVISIHLAKIRSKTSHYTANYTADESANYGNWYRNLPNHRTNRPASTYSSSNALYSFALLIVCKGLLRFSFCFCPFRFRYCLFLHLLAKMRNYHSGCSKSDSDACCSFS